MTVTLEPITLRNFYRVVRLKVADDQQGFVAPNMFSIAEAQFYPGVQTRAIYAPATGAASGNADTDASADTGDDPDSGKVLVGFVMWGEDTAENPGEIWVWRLMIAAGHQGRGYGRAAMAQVIAHVRVDGADALFLSYEPENTGAAAFYARLGFVETGRIEHDEIVVRLALAGA